MLIQQLKNKILPEPILTVFIFVIWLLLSNDLSNLTILGGLLLSFLLPIFTSKLRPTNVQIKKPGKIVLLLLRTLYDMLVSNYNFIKIVFKGKNTYNSNFVRVPLDVRDPNALAMLATIVCFTPGTAWAEISFDRSVLVIHVFDLTTDTDTFVDMVKTRYEQPLMEIFE